MIAKSHRYHGRGSLKRVYANGKTVRGQMLTLKFMPNDRRQAYRCAVVVSRRIHKSAVARNRIRRRVYEEVRALGGQLSQPYDMVFTVFDERLLAMPNEKLRAEVIALAENAHIISKPPEGRNAIIRQQEK